MKKLADIINEKMYKKLGKSVVTLCTDGWTNVRKHKMYNFIVVYRGQAYFIDSVECYTNHAEVIFLRLEKIKAELERRGLIVAAVVGDNASGVQSALAKVEEKDPACLAVRCGAHSLQLLLHDLEGLHPG